MPRGRTASGVCEGVSLHLSVETCLPTDDAVTAMVDRSGPPCAGRGDLGGSTSTLHTVPQVVHRGRRTR